MKRLSSVLILLTILVIPLAFPTQLILTDDCFVQIVSVTLNHSSFEIGEPLQVNLVYDLYYDQTDPLGIGSVSVAISIQGAPIPLTFFEFTNQGFDIHEIINFEISPDNWTPNETGQVGVVLVEGWAQDSVGSMTDSIQLQFGVDRSDLILEIDPLPQQISFHETFNLAGALANPHNSSISIPNHPFLISVSQNNQTIHSWYPRSTLASNFTQPINSTLLGTGEFQCSIYALDSNDYRSTNLTVSFFIDNVNLTLSMTVNTTIVQAYYPSMNNCSILVSAYVHCQAANHTLEETNVICYLGNISKSLTYMESNYFLTDLQAPSLVGNYSLVVTAFAPHHNPINTSTAVNVVHRQPQISFTSNCSEAAFGDFIEFYLEVTDKSSSLPVSDKVCSIFFYNQSVWNLMTQVTLDQNGWVQFYWQAQNVGNEDYRFKVVLNGEPEFEDAEQEHIITNTHNLRFICSSIFDVIRPDDVDFVLQLTTLDFQPLYNISVSLIEILTNSTWCVSITNTSGFATLSWSIDGDFNLGPHEFFVIATDGLTPLGTIRITMIVYEQPILEWV